MFLTSSSWFLWLLILVPFLAWRMFRRSETPSIEFSSVSAADAIPKTFRQRLLWLPRALTLVAITLLIVALARPQEGQKQTVTNSEGIAIELVIDRSSSMHALDFFLRGNSVDRLTAIKDVATRFIRGGNGLEGRYSDLIGMITFAGFADAIVPPTLDHEFVSAQLQETEIVDDRSEDGTAIGDAIGLATEKLSSLRIDDQDNSTHKIKSKVIILLTDGENTAGALKPLPAAELAKSLDIKVYTIGVGTKGRAPVPVRDPFTGRVFQQMMEVNIDEESLQKIADATGGKYFRATNTESLEAIYAEIDRLEKSNIQARQFMDYKELAVESTRFGRFQIPSLLSIAFVCLSAALLLNQTYLRHSF